MAETGQQLLRSGSIDQALIRLETECAAGSASNAGFFHLGLAQHLAGRTEAAIQSLQQLPLVDRRLDAALELLGRCLLETQLADRAEQFYRDWLAASADHPVATFMLAAITEKRAPDRMPAECVAALFDQRAEWYDMIAGYQRSRTAEVFQELLLENAGPPAANLQVLDAGCGTGMLGSLLRGWSSRLVGVDLSAEMLRRAGERKGYDQLVQADLMEWIEQHRGQMDLIVGADSFSNFGDLMRLVWLSLWALRPGGWLMFTVHAGSFEMEDCLVTPAGSFLHSMACVIPVLGENNVPGGVIRRAVLRHEQGKPVHGLLVAIQRPDEIPEVCPEFEENFPEPSPE